MSLLDPKLDAFMAVVEAGTVHGAAKILGLTQTGITQRIRTIEKQLGTTLFTRSRTGMKLSHEGSALLRYCRNAQELEGQVIGEITGISKVTSVQLTLAGPTSIVSSRIIPSCLSIYKEHANLTLHYRLNDEEDAAVLLKTGQVQLAILPPKNVTKEMDSKVLRPDKYVLVASSTWKNRKTAEIIKNERMIDFYESDLTTINYLKSFGLYDKARPERIFANTNYALISLIKHGIGYGTLTQEVAAADIERGHLLVLNQKQVYEDPLALAWYPRKEMPTYFKKIIDSIK